MLISNWLKNIANYGVDLCHGENTEFFILGMMSVEEKSIQIIGISKGKSNWKCRLKKFLSALPKKERTLYSYL